MLIVNKPTENSPIKLNFGDLIKAENGIFMIVCSDTNEMILLDWSENKGADNFNRFSIPKEVNWDTLDTGTILIYEPWLCAPIKKLEYKLELTII